MEKKLIIFTDIGDTVIDQGSEVRRENDPVVIDSACIPGAKETMLELYRRGYTIVMVADGLVQSFANSMRINGLDHIFAARVISEAVGVRKPDAKMFDTAFQSIGLTEADKGRVIMVGNAINRDISGANRYGIRSVLLTWSPRYGYEPSEPDEVPTYTIGVPEELLPLVERLESKLENGD